MKRELASFAGTGKKVRLTRRYPSETLLNGYLLAVSGTLLLMHCFHDFAPDGYTICRIRDIISLRHGPYEEWFHHVLHSERLLKGLRFVHSIDLTNMCSAIRSVANHYDQMIVECEGADGADEDFYIGQLVEVRSRSIQFRDYDALGYWSKSPSSIRIGDITKIQFDTLYLGRFPSTLVKGLRRSCRATTRERAWPMKCTYDDPLWHNSCCELIQIEGVWTR